MTTGKAKKSQPSLDQVDVLAELERIGYEYKPSGEEEVEVLCPAHEDTTPSARVNVKKRQWRCYACKAKGDFVTLLALKLKTKRSVVLLELSTRYDIELDAHVDPAVVEKYHKAVWEAGPLLQALRDRGVTDEMLKAGRIGYSDGRITIPVFDKDGRVVNVRKYLPGATRERKMVNLPGFGKARLYQVEQAIKHERVWVCAGEIKALVVAGLMNQLGVGACASTGGEGSWDDRWTPIFKDKRVWVCMDVDAAGKAGADKVASILSTVAKEVRVVNLPLSRDKYPKGDVNDWVGQEGAKAGDLARLMDAAPVYERRDRQSKVSRGVKEVSLVEARSADVVGWTIKTTAQVAATDTTPYLVPKTVDVACSRDQARCFECPIKALDPDERGFTRVEIPSDDRSIVAMVNATTGMQRQSLLEGLGIPPCKVAELVVADNYTVTDARISSVLDPTSITQGDVGQLPTLVVGEPPELGASYVFSGRTYPHPRSQQAILLFDGKELAADSLSKFAPSDAQLDELRLFQTDPDEIYADIEANVTGIRHRRDMHVVIDLVYHSALHVPLDGRLINGWTNALILGDSAQGKTETTSRLMEHYGLGERVECKNASVAGLIGGVQQLGSRWFVSWGVIPKHDRELVLLEEVKGAAVETIGRLTDMRSSGIAEIPKIERKKTFARTRLLFVSNPRSSRPLSTYSFGVEAIIELIGSMEDVRRFDVAIAVAAGQVTQSQMREETKVEHRFTKELSRRLVLWAWTRKPTDIRMQCDERLEFWADRLSSQFSEGIPLVDSGTVKQKLARLSVAMAARLFSTETGRDLVVRPEHVDMIGELLTRLYVDRAMGYDEFSHAKRESESMADPKEIEKYIVHRTKHPADIVRGMITRDRIVLADFQDWCDVDRDTAQAVVSFLVRKRAIVRDGKEYVKTPECIRLLKTMQGRAEIAQGRKEKEADEADM